MGSQAWIPLCAPFLIGKTPASMISEFQRAEQLLIKRQASINPSSVQFSLVQLFATPWTAAHQASLPIPNSWSFLKLMSIKSVIPSNYLILCRPLLLPSIFPSIRVFSNESVLCIRSPKYWRFSFSISPSNEHPGLISFRMDWFDLLAVQGILKSLLQHHSSKASVLQCSAFFIVQLSCPYVGEEGWVGGGCNFPGSVLPQQKFEMRGELVLQLNFIRKNKG